MFENIDSPSHSLASTNGRNYSREYYCIYMNMNITCCRRRRCRRRTLLELAHKHPHTHTRTPTLSGCINIEYQTHSPGIMSTHFHPNHPPIAVAQPASVRRVASVFEKPLVAEPPPPPPPLSVPEMKRFLGKLFFNLLFIRTLTHTHTHTLPPQTTHTQRSGILIPSSRRFGSPVSFIGQTPDRASGRHWPKARDLCPIKYEINSNMRCSG